MSGTPLPAGVGDLSLDVDADLEVTVNGTPLSVTGSGDRLTVEAPSLRAGLRALRSTGGYAEDLVASLSQVGMTADVVVRGRTVAVVGAGARPNAAGRLVADGVEARVGAATAAALAGMTGG